MERLQIEAEGRVGSTQVTVGSPVFLPGVDLGEFGFEFRLLAERHPQNIAATKPELLPLGERHEPRQFETMFRLLVEFIGPFQQREGILHFGPHLVFGVAQLPVELCELGIEGLDFAIRNG